MTAGEHAPASHAHASVHAAPPHAFEVRERVRWEDVDLVGIMRYSAYTRVFDVAEAELFRAIDLGYPEGLERMRGWLLRKVLHVEYENPARFDAELRVRTWIGRVGRTSLTLHFEVRDADGRVRHAHGHFVLVFVDETMKKGELPALLVERLAAYR